MNRLARIAVLADLIDAMRDAGSWCGETHIQKATHFLEVVTGTDLGYRFILYMHGPFSFGLRDELATAKADFLLDIQPQQVPYGPKWVTTDLSRNLREHFANTLEMHRPGITYVAQHLGPRNVAELEKLATALFVEREEGVHDIDAIAKRVHALKPHIPVDDARRAVTEVGDLVRGWSSAPATGVAAAAH